MNRTLKSGLAVVAAAGLLTAGGMSSSVAAKLINGDRIVPGTIGSTQLANNSVGNAQLKPGVIKDIKNGNDGKDGAQGPAGEQGPAGAQGPAGEAGPAGPASTVPGPAGATGPQGATGPRGANGLTGAIYRVANYTSGGTSSATVACADDDTVSQTYTAIAGGVQASVSNGHPGGGSENADNFAVTSSFPGRMDWVGTDGIRDNGSPGEGEPKAGRLDGWIVFSNGKATDTLRVWALCVPTDSIAVQVNNY